MGHSARVIAVFSGKGGVGKSFVSVHLGRGLAESGYRTLLIDLDLHANGALAALFGIRPLHNVTDVPIVGAGKVRTPILPNLSLVSPPAHLDHVLLAQRSDLTPILTELLFGYDWAVIDLSHRLDLATVSALSLAHWVWVVTSDDPLALHGTANVLGRLDDLRLDRSRIRILVNGASPSGTMPWSGLNTYAIPYDRSVEGGMHPNGVYSQVCMERLRWLAVEEIGWGIDAKRPAASIR